MPPVETKLPARDAGAHKHGTQAGAQNAGHSAMPALSRNNQLVLDELTRADGPLSAYALLDALRDDGLRAPPQIYRALKWLGDHGLVHKLETANAYVACAHIRCCGGAHCAGARTVFLLCDACGRVEEVSGPALTSALEALTADSGFSVQSVHMEMQGRCARCRAT